MEFENAFSRPRKVMDFRKNGGDKISFFGPNILCYLKTGNILLIIK